MTATPTLLLAGPRLPPGAHPAPPPLGRPARGQPGLFLPEPLLPRTGVCSATPASLRSTPSPPQSSVCAKIVQLLGQNEVDCRQKQVVTLSQDSFYRVLTSEQKAKALKGQFNFDHPGESESGAWGWRAEGLPGVPVSLLEREAGGCLAGFSGGFCARRFATHAQRLAP